MLRNTILNERLLTHLRLWTYKITKKRFSMLSLAAIMIIGTFAFANNLFFPTAKATYVEGAITQDTIWTLVDSPFVVSNNVTVYSSATLTVEPGVEVMFGGDFSLIVEGRLIANGTQGRMITFNSNEYQPGPGDWGSIELGGAQPSLLAYCSIEYAQTGITTEHSSVAIRNSVISNNYQYGISIANSTAQIQADEIASNSLSGVYISGTNQVTIQNDTIANNSQSGIYVIGNNQVTIQNDTIRSNSDGILLDGNVSSVINISQNLVLSNTQSGIHLNATAYSSLTILDNTLSANDKGFFISGNASTQITNNSVSFNNVGFLYAAGQGHQAHWNDIYGNVMGMDAYYPTDKSVEVVDATYNYWGNESGPYHISLNPGGTGNPVGGDGVNLDFIFFLTAPIGYINERPVAWLWADKKLVSPNQSVTFIATNSSDDRRVDQYFFDFGDGQNSGWTTLSIFVHEYSSPGTYNATLTVMDDFVVTSNNIATAKITCQALTPLTVSLIPSSLVIGSGRQVPITVQVTNTTSTLGVINANVSLLSIIGRSLTSSFGSTNATGYFNTTFSAPNVTQITNIRMTAAASRTGYADGSDYKYLMVVPPLSVQVTANPDIIKSEATSNVTVQVTYSGTPVSGAIVNISSNNGSFAQRTGVTDANGSCVFVFAAPQTATQLEANILVTATKSGYIDGQGQTQLTVEPKVLLVQVFTTPTSVNSEMPSNVTVHVSYGSNPISGATVVLSSGMGGSFDPANGTTDTSGGCKFTFTSPQVAMNSSITITATASKVGYADGVNRTTLTVNLGTLVVQLVASPYDVQSKATSTITVHVTYNAKPVANAAVALLSGVDETLSATTGTTDANGNCTFVFAAPETTAQSTVFMAANATKSGYIGGRGEIGITIEPAGASGLPLWLILMIIAVVIVAVVLILIKLKILVIGSKGE